MSLDNIEPRLAALEARVAKLEGRMSWDKLPKQYKYALIAIGVIVVLSLGFTYDWV